MRLITAYQHYSLLGSPSLLRHSHVPISKQANKISVTARAFNVCATRCHSFSCCCLRDKATAIAAQFRLASHAPLLRSVQITLIRSPDSHPPCYCCCSSCCCCYFVCVSLLSVRFGSAYSRVWPHLHLNAVTKTLPRVTFVVCGAV